MMNILSQLIQSGGTNTQSSQISVQGDTTSSKADLSQKFADFMMGMLGGSSDKTEGAQQLKSTLNKEGAKQESQLTEKQQSNQEGNAGVFVGAKFLSITNVREKNVVPDSSVGSNSSSTNEKSAKLSSGKANIIIRAADAGSTPVVNQLKWGSSPIKMRLPSMEQAKVAVSAASQGKNTQSSTTVSGRNKAEAKLYSRPLSTSLMGLTKGDSKLNIPFTNSKNTKMSVLGQQTVENPLSGANIADLKAQGQPMEKLRKALEQMLSKKRPKLGTNQQMKQAASASQTEGNGAAKASGETQLQSLLKTAGQRDNSAKVTGAKEVQQTIKSSQKQSFASTHSKSGSIGHFLQQTGGAKIDQSVFRPLYQQSSSFELDPSKLVKPDKVVGKDVEMKLQSQADKDASAKEESKAFIKMKGTNVNQLSKGSGRREFSTQLVRQLQKQSEGAKSGAAQKWSHHRFMMDDGKSLNVSVRHAEGAMQLQLSAGNNELNKVIQQHINDIRQHLQEQMNVEIDLQLQHFGGQQTGSQDGQSAEDAGTLSKGLAATESTGGDTDQSPQRTKRYLGFNNNEWTA
jgi:hypothetical protein